MASPRDHHERYFCECVPQDRHYAPGDASLCQAQPAYRAKVGVAGDFHQDHKSGPFLAGWHYKDCSMWDKGADCNGKSENIVIFSR